MDWVCPASASGWEARGVPSASVHGSELMARASLLELCRPLAYHTTVALPPHTFRWLPHTVHRNLQADTWCLP